MVDGVLQMAKQYSITVKINNILILQEAIFLKLWRRWKNTHLAPGLNLKIKNVDVASSPIVFIFKII